MEDTEHLAASLFAFFAKCDQGEHINDDETGHVAGTEEMIHAHKVLLGRPEGKIHE